METLLAIFGAKWCCVFASTMGGLTNGLVHTWLGWVKEAKNLAIAAIVGWIAAEFFIGYSGIRLLPHLETQVFKRLDKIIGGTEEEKDKKGD